jgi:hypothetical protein
MRCVACNKNLTDFEATRRIGEDFIDLCNDCARLAEVSTTAERFDLIGIADVVDLEGYDVEDERLDYFEGAEQGVSNTLDDDYTA